MKKIASLACLLTLVACSSSPSNVTTEENEGKSSPSTTSTQAVQFDSEKLNKVLDQQEASVQARYSYRHPDKTLEFFRIAPGMTVAEVLPGGGWYSKILLPYLGPEGKLIGLDYSLDLWKKAAPAYVETKKTWADTWPKSIQPEATSDSAELSAYLMSDVPESLYGKVDRVLFFRALHIPNRVGEEYIVNALETSHKLLKKGGIVGVVQHEAMESKTDSYANGRNGYLKKSRVIQLFTENGFQLMGSTNINQNAKDRPADDEQVWRLPPSLRTSDDKKAQMEAIGESNRMTLIFRKI